MEINKKNKNTIPNSKISFYINDIKRSVKKKYHDGKYQFNINLKLPISVTESPIKLNDSSEGKLIKEIENDLQKELSPFLNPSKMTSWIQLATDFMLDHLNTQSGKR
nr:Ger(x)C family spore germination C-terminal domain-containing protein [Bacillus sp. AFS088145]